MPVYLFEAPDGETIERAFPVGDCPDVIAEGKVYKKIIAPVSICAYTVVGEKLAKHEERTYRTNKCTAEGLAKGTMREPEGRDVAGDKQSRESVRQFNEMYDRTKKMGSAT